MDDVVRIIRYKGGEAAEMDDAVVEEHKLNVHVQEAHYISLMCLPQSLEELTVGFLFSEGLIRSYADVVAMHMPTPDDVFVALREAPDPAAAAKRVLASGFTKGSINLSAFERGGLSVQGGQHRISAGEIVQRVETFNRRSALFRQTGAVHSCMLVLPDGDTLFYEDIGRHNAIDKVVGRALIQNLRIDGAVLLTSGRISSEMLIKTANLGIPILISISAPTKMAVACAREANLTLIGFARGDRFNVYAGAGRIGGMVDSRAH